MSTVDMTEIRKHDDASMSTKAKENALIRSQVDDKDHGIENLLEVPEKDAGHQDLPSPDSIPTQVDGFSGQEQGMDAKVGGPSKQNDYLGPNKQHCGNREVSSIRHSTEDLQIQVKVSRSDQQMKLVRSCQASDTVENKQKPCEKLDGHGPPSCDSTEICSSSGDKAGRLKRRKVRKVRLMTDLLGEKGNLNAEPSRTRDSSLLLAVLDRSEEVGTIEDVKKGLHAQDRKRNLPSDEYFKMRKTVISNKEFEKVEIVRGKATNPKALVGSALDKDALVKLSLDSAMKTDGMKYRCADSNAFPNRKLKKKNNNQIIDQSFQIKESDLMQSKNDPMAGVGSFVENDASRRRIATTIVRCDKSKLGVDFAAAESKGETYGMPLMYEKQAYASQSKDETRSAMLQKDVQVVSTKGNICSQDQEAMKSKLYSEVADATVPAPVISDGIPMEIVELMAKIQHDNRLYDDANSKKKLNSSLHKSSKEQHNPKITKLGKQKMVSFSSQVTTNQMCTDSSAEKTHISKRRGAFRLYQEVCDSIPVRHRSSEAVGPWSSAMSMNSSPQERVKFLNFKSVNPEKKKHKKDLHLEPPRQNVSNLQNQFGPPADIYSNENIPAMHLLSLMEAGRKSGQSSCTNGAPSRLEKQQQTPLPHLYHSKESEGYPTVLAGMNLSVYDNAADRSNHATRDGNSSSCLLQRDESFRRDSVVPPTSLNQFKARDKGKGKLEGSTAQNLPRKSDTTLLNPMIFNTVGKKKLKSHNIIVDWTSKASPEPEICCTINRNPADFSFPGPGNSYMIRGNEIKYFSRRTTVRHCTQNSEHEIKIHLTAAALLAELQTVFPSSDITCWSSF